MHNETSRHLQGWVRLLVGSSLVAVVATIALASDHSDAPILGTLTRTDASITDLHAFVVGPNLVLALSTNPAIPPSATSYLFPADVKFEIHIDVDSPVGPTDALGDGGTVLEPDRIDEDVTFRLRFKEDGSPVIQRIQRLAHRPWGARESEALVLSGSAGSRGGPVAVAPRDEFSFPAESDVWRRRGGTAPDPTAADRVLARTGIVAFFAGLRDDPFVRAPRAGRNVAAIVIEVPLEGVLHGQSTLLVWATSQVEEMDGRHQEIAGRSLRSMFGEQRPLNELAPRDHLRVMGMRPDVMIFDTARSAAYPNGRALQDDVVDLACSLGGECRVASVDAPFPPTNDVPFLSEFPYLAPPHVIE